MHKRTRIFTFLLCALVCLSSLFSLSASAAPPLPSADGAPTVYLWNAEYNKTITSRSESEKIYPASMTKIMTGLVAIDLIGDRLDEKLTVSAEMLRGANGTSMQIATGEVLSYRDLLYGAICGGFNDATTALAVSSAGTLSAFVNKMNEKAQSLGALDTFYTNPTGWHDDAMVTTLADTVKIAKAAMKNELYMTVSSATSYTVEKTNKSDEFTVHNRNGLISSHYAYGYYNRRAKGLIAGMTDEGGYCVATVAEYGGLSYLCIVMGAGAEGERIGSYEIANSLISYAITYFGEAEVIKKGETVAEIKTALAAVGGNGGDRMLKCTVPEDVTVLAAYEGVTPQNVELRHYFFREEIKAPVSEGDVVGGVDIYVDGVFCGSAPLCAAETVEANEFLTGIDRAKDFLTGRAFIIFLIIFIVIAGIYLYNTELKELRKKHKNIKFDKLY